MSTINGTSSTLSPPRRRMRRWMWPVAAVILGVAVTVAELLVHLGHRPPSTVALPLRPAGQLSLPGPSSRFDYESLDPDRGLLFIAHLGASQVIEVDIHTNTVVRTIP